MPKYRALPVEDLSDGIETKVFDAPNDAEAQGIVTQNVQGMSIILEKEVDGAWVHVKDM